MKLTKELYDRIMFTAPAQFGHHLQHGFMHPRIKPVVPSMKVLGPAYTVRITERDGSALYYALMKAEPGSVIVIDRGEDDVFAPIGDQCALMAKHRGMAGFVCDGPVTDRVGLEKLGLPVFCTGFSPVTTLCTGTNGEVNIPIACGGAVVKPGDIIFGDADGVVVLPENFEEYLAAAETMTRNEIERGRKVAEEGFKWLRRTDVNIEKFFEADKDAVINAVKAKHPAK